MKPRERLPREADVQKGGEEIGKSVHRNTHVRYKARSDRHNESCGYVESVEAVEVCAWYAFFGVNGSYCSSQWSVIRNCRSVLSW